MHLSLRHQRLAAVGLLLLWCVALLCYQLYLGSNRLVTALLWNLFLAAVPLLFAAAFQTAIARHRLGRASLWFMLWLLFFPNAPYILTDLIHLRAVPGVPLWYTLALLLSCAGAGTLLGYLSLLDVHSGIARKFGQLAGWAVALASLMLCGFGIYVGRFLRWNSWNAINDPFNLLKDVAGRFNDPGVHPHPIGVTLVFGIGLIVGYIALRIIARPMPTH